MFFIIKKKYLLGHNSAICSLLTPELIILHCTVFRTEDSVLSDLIIRKKKKKELL